MWEGLFHTYGPQYLIVAATVACSLIGVVHVGDHRGLDAPVHLAAPRVRPRERLGAVRRHAGRRERPGHLFHGGRNHPARKVALTSLGRRGEAASPGYACALLLAIAFLTSGCGGEGPSEPEPPPPVRADELVNTGCPPLPPISGFVGRADGALLLNGITAYRATGTNLYYLQQLLSYAQQEQDPQALEAVREVLDDLVCLSLPVARIWGFNDSQDSSSIRHSPGEGFREEGLRGLDQAVWEAKRRGIRLILPLVNNWAEYGGLPAYATWAAKLYGSPVSRDDFYRDAQMQQWWKDYAFMLVNRVNSFTGIRYRDEPAILAWRSATSSAARPAPAPPACPTPSPRWPPS